MIVRESPSRPKPISTWPPKSPREALMSSPSRRTKLATLASRRSTSPSPSKRQIAPSSAENEENNDPGAPSAEDDEETLQLKLQAIETRLRLKRLQKSKSTDYIDVEKQSNTRKAISQSLEKATRSATGQEGSPVRQRLVEVPLSPTRRTLAQNLENSPKRVRLGIDKGMTAHNVSLKRPRSNVQEEIEKRRKGDVKISQLERKATKSFSERLAEARDVNRGKASHEERLAKGRSKGFGIRNSETSRPGTGDPSSKVQSTAPARQFGSQQSEADRHRDEHRQIDLHEDAQDEADETRKWTRLNYSSRIISDRVLSEAFADKTLFSIPKLLSQVVAPTYDPPDIDTDYVVYGIIAHKTVPHTHNPTHKVSSKADPDEDPSKQRSKFMVLHLTDLKWQVDLFLFGTAFERFWKLTVGTIIAILNPAIMPPKAHMRHSGNFALKLGSSEDTILEIGRSKDLGWCTSIKKDGKECGQWIDTRKTEFCDFHVNLAVEKTKAGRMEINTINSLDLGAGQRRQGRGGGASGNGFNRGNSRARGGAKGKGDRNAAGQYYDRSAREVAYQIPVEYQRGVSTAKMLDVEDYVNGGLSKAERSQKRLAEQQKERDLAKQLSAIGSGVGRDYMRQKQTDIDAERDGGSSKRADERLDANTLGLVHAKGAEVKLSPVKGGRLRGDMSMAQPMGWSGAYKRGLPSPERQTSPTRSTALSRPKSLAERDQTPAAKKARFMIAKKGIRHPGRESFPETVTKLTTHEDYDDDNLDIV